MKRNLFLLAILPFSLAVALCACGSTPGESTPSEKTQSSVSQAQTDSAATGNEISIGNNFSIEAGTVLSDTSNKNSPFKVLSVAFLPACASC